LSPAASSEFSEGSAEGTVVGPRAVCGLLVVALWTISPSFSVSLPDELKFFGWTVVATVAGAAGEATDVLFAVEPAIGADVVASAVGVGVVVAAAVGVDVAAACVGVVVAAAVGANVVAAVVGADVVAVAAVVAAGGAAGGAAGDVVDNVVAPSTAGFFSAPFHPTGIPIIVSIQPLPGNDMRNSPFTPKPGPQELTHVM